jgi:hypothetical protein
LQEKTPSRYVKHTGDKGSGDVAPTLLTSALDGGEWSASSPDRALPQGNDLGTHWIRGWVGLRASLDAEARVKIL